MPALYSLAVHPALHAAAAELRAGEAVFVFLDDTYVAAPPERVATVHAILQEAQWNHARIRLNAGKTRIWNAAGEEPPGIDHLQTASGGPVWTGAWSLPLTQQGILVFGAPIGSEVFVQRELRNKRDVQDEPLRRLPALPGLQAAWLQLLFCASPCHLPPAHALAGSNSQLCPRSRCGSANLQVPGQPLPEQARRTLHLPLGFGGLGLRATFWSEARSSVLPLYALLSPLLSLLSSLLPSPLSTLLFALSCVSRPSPKVTTASRIATTTPPIPVTVETQNETRAPK